MYIRLFKYIICTKISIIIRDMKEKKEKKDTDNNIVETEKNNTKKFLLWNKQT